MLFVIFPSLAMSMLLAASLLPDWSIRGQTQLPISAFHFLYRPTMGSSSNINGTNMFRLAIMTGTNALIKNCNFTFTVALYEYIQWIISVTNSSVPIIQDCNGVSPFLISAFEMFACNGAKIIRCGGQNCKYSTNSSTSWTIDFGPGQTTVDDNNGKLH